MQISLHTEQSQQEFFDKGSHGVDGEFSPPSKHQLGSYNNLFDASNTSNPPSNSISSTKPANNNSTTSVGAAFNAAYLKGGSSHNLRGGENHSTGPKPGYTQQTVYHRAASASPQRHHHQRTPTASDEDDSGLRSPSGGSLPTSPSTERLASRSAPTRFVGRLQDGNAREMSNVRAAGPVGAMSNKGHVPQPIKVTSPYVTAPPPLSAGGTLHSPSPGREGFMYRPAAPSPGTAVRDRSRTFYRARSRSRESLNRSRENISRSREYLSSSKEGLSNSEEMLNRSREASISSYHSMVGSMAGPAHGRLGSAGSAVGNHSGAAVPQNAGGGEGPDGRAGGRPMTFVRALQMTEAAEVREREQTQNSRLRRMRKESSRSVYDTTYEASV